MSLKGSTPPTSPRPSHRLGSGETNNDLPPLPQSSSTTTPRKLTRTQSSTALPVDSSLKINEHTAALRRTSSEGDLLGRVGEGTKLQRPSPSQRKATLASSSGLGGSTDSLSLPQVTTTTPTVSVQNPLEIERQEQLRLANGVHDRLTGPSASKGSGSTKTLQGTKHIRHLTASYGEIDAFLKQGWGVVRAMNETDQKHILKGQDIARTGGGTNITAHVTGQNRKKSALIPASSEILHTFSNGATGHALLLTPKYYRDKGLVDSGEKHGVSGEEYRKLASQFIPHEQVLEALNSRKSNADDKDIQNSREAREVMFNTQGKPLSLKHVVNLDNGLPQKPLSEVDGRYDQRRVEREEKVHETQSKGQQALYKTLRTQLGRSDLDDLQCQKLLSHIESSLGKQGLGAMDVKKWARTHKGDVDTILK